MDLDEDLLLPGEMERRGRFICGDDHNIPVAQDVINKTVLTILTDIRLRTGTITTRNLLRTSFLNVTKCEENYGF